MVEELVKTPAALWMELRLDAVADAVDWVCTRLATTSYTGSIHITPYVAPIADDNADYSTIQAHWASTIFLNLRCDGSENIQLAEIENALYSLCHADLTTALQQRYVATPYVAPESISYRVGKRFVITSADAFVHTPSAIDIVINLKPSSAFGSGLHPATQLTLQLIERYVKPNMNVLDLGSGSGILSVAMAKLGAQVVAIDNDPVSVRATTDAVQRNELTEKITVLAGSLGQGNKLGHWLGGAADLGEKELTFNTPVDLIAANVQARFHIALATDFRHALHAASAQGGLLITGGYTIDYAPAVEEALAVAGFEHVADLCNHDWIAQVHRLVTVENDPA